VPYAELRAHSNFSFLEGVRLRREPELRADGRPCLGPQARRRAGVTLASGRSPGCNSAS